MNLIFHSVLYTFYAFAFQKTVPNWGESSLFRFLPSIQQLFLGFVEIKVNNKDDSFSFFGCCLPEFLFFTKLINPISHLMMRHSSYEGQQDHYSMTLESGRIGQSFTEKGRDENVRRGVSLQCCSRRGSHFSSFQEQAFLRHLYIYISFCRSTHSVYSRV